MPSDLIARHFVFCFHDDAFGVRQRHEITHGNTMRFLQFDPFKHIARDVDVTSQSLGGRAPTHTGKVLSAREISSE
jgi:hypothetical protein